MSKPDGGPAFAVTKVDHASPERYLSLRDYFAGQFLSTVKIMGDVDARIVAASCYEMADAMLAERAK